MSPLPRRHMAWGASSNCLIAFRIRTTLVWISFHLFNREKVESRPYVVRWTCLFCLKFWNVLSFASLRFIWASRTCFRHFSVTSERRLDLDGRPAGAVRHHSSRQPRRSGCFGSFGCVSRFRRRRPPRHHATASADEVRHWRRRPSVDSVVSVWPYAARTTRTQQVDHNPSDMWRAAVLSPGARIICTIHTVNLIPLIESHGLSAHLHADDMQVCGSWRPVDVLSFSTKLCRCVDKIQQTPESNPSQVWKCATIRRQHKLTTNRTTVDPVKFVLICTVFLLIIVTYTKKQWWVRIKKAQEKNTIYV